MSYIERHTVTLTTSAGGTAEGYTPAVTGNVVRIYYVKDDFAAGVDFAITSEDTAESIWTESNVDATTVRWLNYPIALDRVKISISSGGDTKTGTFYVYVG